MTYNIEYSGQAASICHRVPNALAESKTLCSGELQAVSIQKPVLIHLPPESTVPYTDAPR